MSLFPDGTSVGMSGFSKGDQGDDKKIEKEEIQETSQNEDLDQSFLNKESVDQHKNGEVGFVEGSEVSDQIPINVKSEQKENYNEEKINSQSEEKIENKESIKSPTENNLNPNTSVRIAGLTVDENTNIKSEFSPKKISVDIPTANNPQIDDLYENLSDSERGELEDMSDMYFERFNSNSNPAGGITLDQLLDLAIDKEASDIHFSAGSQIGLRVNGKIFFIDNVQELTSAQTRNLVFAIISNPLHRKRIFEERELDCAYEHRNGVNFRVNIFFKRGKLAAVLRKISSEALTMEQLGLPKGVKELLNKKQGLLLVTGPTGSGKSTTLQTMLDYINETRVEHILTIEDPIEFLFRNKKSIFSQRELGRDTHSFTRALRASLREDPDVVMIGEMRDAETMQAAMNLSETGHLVLSTLHTSSATHTVARLVSNFPSTEQEQVQSRLADTLIGVLSQRLVPRADRDGRIALFELMIVNSGIRNIIRTGDMGQIHNAMISGRDSGMLLMEDFANNLAEQGLIKKESYQNFFREE